jgi:hypothetical protein
VTIASDRIIFIIRHGEKPGSAAPGSEPCATLHGIDYCGNQNDASSLTPRGWSRAGALVRYFGPAETPQQLFSPGYPKGSTPTLADTQEHRTYQTICQLADELGVSIDYTTYQEGCESAMGQALAKVTTGITLVCWEHTAIPTIACNIAPQAQIPTTWPDDRFDVVWSFTYTGNGYEFGQIPQMLLPGDSVAPITGATVQTASGAGV